MNISTRQPRWKFWLGFALAAIMMNLNVASYAQPIEPVNPHASEEARHLLQFLNSISGKYVLSGQHNYTESPSQWDREVQKMTGKSPVIWGSDFGFNFENSDHDKVRQNLVDVAKEKYKEGRIITLMWHNCPPEDGFSCTQDSIWVWDDVYPQSKWYEFTTPGTELNKKWRAQVDNVAKYLKQLQEAHIPVLWRPYHEMNGMWFWWCQHPGEQGFARLWKLMYNRLVNVHGLNNLIWVWNANAPRDTPGDKAYPYEDFYPGGAYVDILAADVYHNDYRRSHHDQLVNLAMGKPIALGEVGQLPSPESLREQPQWTWFMEWAGWLKKANEPEAVKALYNDPRVITLDEITRNADGTYDVHPEN